MKGVYVALITVVVLAVVVAGGVLFVFGGNVFPAEEVKAATSDNARVAIDILENEDNIEDKTNDAIDSSGGGGGASSDSIDGVVDSGCVLQPVQYSLGEFVEQIECLFYGVDGCERVLAICESEIFNLDYDFGGDFVIKQSLFDGEDELDFELIEENVDARERVALRSEISLDGDFDVESLRCVVDSVEIPSRCL